MLIEMKKDFTILLDQFGLEKAASSIRRCIYMCKTD